MEKKQIGYYDYTVILTYCGTLSAITGIFQVLQGHYLRSLVLLMIAGICDMFDGMVASTKRRTPPEKCFGIQIDSLSDLISFGVLPGLFLFTLTDGKPLYSILTCIYILCALIRLAYFNVLEEARQKETTQPRKTYLGLPVTSIALLLPGAFLLTAYGIVNAQLLVPLVMLLTAIGFITPFEIGKPQKTGKLVLILLGLVEFLGLFLLIGATPL